MQDAESIQVLLNSEQRGALLPFVGQEMTVTRAARQSGSSANTTLARVKRWVRLGILRTVGEEHHPRGVSKVYRSSADAYWVPYRFTSAESLTELARAVYLPLLDRMLREYAGVGARLGGDWGLLFQRRGGTWNILPTQAAECRCSPLDEPLPAALLELETLVLTSGQAKALQRGLMQLLEQYRHGAHPHGETYNVFIGLAPAAV
ncbi:hypothetical protein SAMN00790413_06186 [Deinococcus hopiensis KR-140]|uniref:Uncharacterized protein n=1 Tax=Deinococcus hopiensis KR-140 TaxID=695939 RepID=A0A1W1VU87_9DEIO|nr:hypothetical protein SAMN00790413_06186 [Deinococcus hopiensis KR-140]